MNKYVRRVTQAPKPLLSRLAHLDVELTERCDNDCIHCCINLPAGDAAARAREMTTDQIESLLRQAADLGCLQVRFTGGEPLLRSDFEELYLAARHLGLRVLIFTNARRITAHLASVFASIPPLTPIEVTVYGMRKESYEAVSRTPGSFAQFRRGIALLLEHQVPFVVKGVLLPPNRGETDEFEAWARTLPWMDKSPGYSMFFDLRNRRDDSAKNDLICSLRVTPEEGLAVLARHEAEYREGMAQFAASFVGKPDNRLFHCGAGHSISLDAYGAAQPCMGLRAPEFSIDTSRSSLAEALDRFASLSELRATDPEYLRRCAVCSIRSLCEQCPAKSWSEHRTLDTPVEYLCRVAHAQARFLGWLGRDEYAWNTKVPGETAD